MSMKHSVSFLLLRCRNSTSPLQNSQINWWKTRKNTSVDGTVNRNHLRTQFSWARLTNVFQSRQSHLKLILIFFFTSPLFGLQNNKKRELCVLWPNTLNVAENCNVCVRQPIFGHNHFKCSNPITSHMNNLHNAFGFFFRAPDRR